MMNDSGVRDISWVLLLRLKALLKPCAKPPNLERPYKAFAYMVAPALYIIGALVILVVLLIYQIAMTWPGLLIVLTSVPVYFAWRAAAHRRGVEPGD